MGRFHLPKHTDSTTPPSMLASEASLRSCSVIGNHRSGLSVHHRSNYGPRFKSEQGHLQFRQPLLHQKVALRVRSSMSAPYLRRMYQVFGGANRRCHLGDTTGSCHMLPSGVSRSRLTLVLRLPFREGTVGSNPTQPLRCSCGGGQSGTVQGA